MKCLSLLVNESTKRELVELLQGLPEVSAYTIFHGEGHHTGDQQPFDSALDEVMGFVPRIRIDLFVAKENLTSVVERIKGCGSCEQAKGLYWVSAVEAMGEF